MPEDTTGLQGFTLSQVPWGGPVLPWPAQWMAHTPQVMLAHCLRLFVSVRTDATDHVGKVVSRGCVADLAGMLTILVVQTHRSIQRHQEGGVGVAVLRGPLDGLRTPGARDPDRRMGFLEGQHPGINHPEVIVPARPADRTRPGPRGWHRIVTVFHKLRSIIGLLIVGQ